MPSSNGPLNGTRGKLSNDPRDRGASPPQRAIQEYDVGQKVHLKLDPSVSEGRFHPRFNGHTGTVVGTQGSAFKVEINDGGKDKTVIARPAHLKAQQ
ncbi:50S ribosomal protein L21e [Haloplanus rallus]|jgi:large subunit ribosomal protein L21e|uniref:Large ribosomal subunit protein eL21 n=1 Tax=Haloplanus rallus TaxID=1816183 RepID=A0A6B9FBY9_9EURY|nr:MULTISPECIES: 50S ribosomal protein L21e [Haloplanus]QGX93680.1 50S ribosomal protein L21e [Haloplanus rallus]